MAYGGGENPYYGGAGGFMGGTTNSPGGSQSPGGGKKSDNSTLRPVTIMQIHQAHQANPDADFTIDGADVRSVFLIGVVRNFAKTATNKTYSIEDGTGTIDARVWTDKQDEEGLNSADEQDQYVAVMGPIKSFSGKRHISAQSIRKIEDHNEVFYHLLQSLYVSLQLRNPGAGQQKSFTSKNNNNNNSDYTMNNANNQNNNGGGNDDRWTDLPPLHRRVMETVSSETETDDGVHVATIARQMGGAGEGIMEAIEYLISEGQLYTTMDDMHVKVV